MALAGLAGKVAVVTGGGSGIGAGVARRLSTEGASVVVVDADGSRAEEVAGSLSGAALAVTADVSREDGVEGYTNVALERFGRLDLYHLNAGIAGPLEPFPDIDVADFDRVVAVNLRGLFLGLRAAFRQYALQESGGAVVTTASIAGYRGAADLVPYHATKHGVVGLMKCGAVFGGQRGIRVNAVAPGIIPTNLLGRPEDEAASSTSRAARALATPMERVGTVEEVAALVAFLLSDEAAYVTGGVFPADGGASAVNPFRPWHVDKPDDTS